MAQTSVVDATKAQAETVIRWLKDEHLNELEGLSGFYFNRSIIRSAAQYSEMKCLLLGRKIIGFAVFASMTINIFEIRPNARGQGFGRHFATNIINMLFDRGAPEINVECSPRSSEPFWRGLGFVEKEDMYQSWGSNPKLVLRKP